MKTLIKGGTVITAADTLPADILIDGGKIAMMGVDLPSEGMQSIDASSKLILASGIDMHTHMELPFFGTIAADDFYTGQKAAAFGGTTTHLDFVIQGKGESLHQAIENWHQKSGPKAVTNYGFHMAITDLTDEVIEEIPSIADEGVTSLKLFMAYMGVFQVDDTTLFKSLMKAAEAGMIIMLHAENGDLIDTLINDTLSMGNLATEYHARSHPAWAEAEATMRAVALAGNAGATPYVVHMTCEESVDQLRYGRAHGLNVMGETCTQYLFFTVDNLRQPDGAKWIMTSRVVWFRPKPASRV